MPPPILESTSLTSDRNLWNTLALDTNPSTSVSRNSLSAFNALAIMAAVRSPSTFKGSTSWLSAIGVTIGT